jgi:hypothetical protein
MRSVDSYDAELDQCWFRCACFPHDRLLVQTTRISPFDHGVGVVYAIIGEVDARGQVGAASRGRLAGAPLASTGRKTDRGRSRMAPQQPVLKARVAVPMAGVDTKLYVKALAMRREFLGEVVPTNDPDPVVMELASEDEEEQGEKAHQAARRAVRAAKPAAGPGGKQRAVVDLVDEADEDEA